MYHLQVPWPDSPFTKIIANLRSRSFPSTSFNPPLNYLMHSNHSDPEKAFIRVCFLFSSSLQWHPVYFQLKTIILHSEAYKGINTILHPFYPSTHKLLSSHFLHRNLQLFLEEEPAGYIQLLNGLCIFCSFCLKCLFTVYLHHYLLLL